MKKTLLIAVAALAAGVISTQAQVYSQNIVGYANVVTPSSGAYYLLTTPFKIGSSNGVNEVFAGGLPDGSTINIWDQNSLAYTGYVYDTSVNPGSGINWYQSDDATALTTFPVLAIGQGFFLVPNGPVTNVFAGAIATSVGTSNSIVLANSGAYYLVGSPVPYAGSVTNGTSSNGGINLNGLPDGSTINIWDPNTLSYTGYVYDTSVNPGSGVNWYQSDDATPQAPPTVTVGQGFFIVPNGSYTWKVGL
jgi:hypothetical protein